jgi:hypothetical protein
MSESTAASTPAETSATDQGEVTYPQGTAVADMTVEQQAAYWQAQARSHEKQWKALKGTDEGQLKKQLREAQKELETFRQASMTDQEKAVEEAKNWARTETLKQLGTHLVNAEFRAQAAGRDITAERLAVLLEDLDMSKYLTDEGQVDTERVAKKVDALAPKPDPTAAPTWPDLGQGARDTSNLALNDDGLTRALAAKVGAPRR